jgi:hypothetical protein
LKYNNDKGNRNKKLANLINDDLSVSIFKLKNRKYVKSYRKKDKKPRIRECICKENIVVAIINPDVKNGEIENNYKRT